MNWLLKAWEWFTGEGEDRRQGDRFRPGMGIYYWTGEQVKPYRVRDIGQGGLFVETSDYWGPGTSLHVQLHDTEEPGSATKMSVLAEVVRHGQDGMGMRFVFQNSREQKHFTAYLAGLRRRGQTGTSLIEFAVILPLLFLLIINAVNFGGFFFAWITMASASRSGSQYASLAGASVMAPAAATATQIYNVVTADISALPNRGTLAVRVCTNNGGTIACGTSGTGTFTDPPVDARPESSLYVMNWVDVQYTYAPFIPLFDFPNLGIHATLPPTTIRRQTVMRMLQ